MTSSWGRCGSPRGTLACLVASRLVACSGLLQVMAEINASMTGRVVSSFSECCSDGRKSHGTKDFQGRVRHPKCEQSWQQAL